MNIHIYPFCFLINPLNAELNPICHLLALLGADHILHVSKLRVKYPGCFESDKALNGCHYFVFSVAKTSGNISTVKCTLLLRLRSTFNAQELTLR
jgi:hypothetical protein